MSLGVNPSDLDLLRRYADSRDAEAFAELTSRYARMVYSVALRVTGRPHDAEDIAQACFLELARRSGEVRTSVGGWLHSLATSRATNAVRDRSTRARHERQAAEANAEESFEPGWSELAPLIDSSIASLHEEVRLPLVLHYLHGQSQQEIARTLRISQPTVSRRLGAGVEQLRAALRARGVVGNTMTVASVASILEAVSESAAATVIPGSLNASLGKLALSGIGPGAAPLMKTPVGLSSLIKWVIASAVASAALAMGAYLLFRWSDVSPLERRIRSSESPAVVTRSSDGQLQVRGVSPLQWGATQSGNTTVLGALAVAMRSAGSEVDYTQLMGDSGVAFRTRWMNLESATFPDPFRAVRLVANRDLPMIERSTGWRLALVTEFTPGRKDLTQFTSAVVESIRAGKSVVAEDTHESAAGLIFAADADGGRLTMHEYGGGASGRVVRPQDLGGGLLFLCERRPALSRRDAVIAALQRAMEDWNRPVELSPAAAFQYGDNAWEAWIEQVRTSASMPTALQQRFQHVSWWSFDVVCDARFHAAAYLRRHADLFPGPARHAMLAAAEQYERLEKEGLVDPAYRQPDGPWSPTTLARWRARNPAGAHTLGRVRAIDATAMRRIAEALRTMNGER